MYAAKRAFPAADLYVLLCGPPTSSSAAISNIIELNNLIKSRTPAGCTIINHSEVFDAVNEIWNGQTKAITFKALNNFLE